MENCCALQIALCFDGLLRSVQALVPTLLRKAGNDVIKEIRWLGRDIICELHMKENGALLGQGTMDWQKILGTLNEMKYRGDGWMQIEGARPKDGDVVESYKHNLRFLRNLFRT